MSVRRVFTRLLLLGAAGSGLVPAYVQAQAPWPPPSPSTKAAQPLGAPAPAASYKPITWAALAPPGWDAMQGFRGVNIDALQDGDPKATELLKKMREAWDNAPVNMAMVAQPVRIAGYVVPLETGADGLKEFLLVPSYGACIHTPPPPSNQVIHVLPRTSAKGFKTMDTVWVSGVLAYARNQSDMANSSWRIEAVSVQRYADK